MIDLCLPISQYIFFLTVVLNNIDLPFIQVQFQPLPGVFPSAQIRTFFHNTSFIPFHLDNFLLILNIVISIQLSQEKLSLLLDLVSSIRLHTPLLLTQQISKCGPWIFRSLRPFWGRLQIQRISMLKLGYYVLAFCFTRLPFGLMGQKQWWIKLPTLQHKSRQQNQTILRVFVLFTMHSKWGVGGQFYLRLSLMKH